jgi:sigma-B regulation protein RsbU (phosphoserine phosphatase)
MITGSRAGVFMDEISSFLLSVIESSGDAIIGLQPDGCVISWNAGAERIYGYSADDMPGKSISCLSLPDRSDETALILARILNGERIRHFQTTHLKKGGIPIPVSLSISPVFDDLNRVVGASFIARDLSHQYTFEKTLRETEQRYQKLKSSLELAHQIQETLLPSVNDFSSELDIYVKTLYCEDIGGDYYDFFRPRTFPDHILGIAVGDVSGHGTGAALLMAMAKGILQAEVEHSPFDLVPLMNRLNQFYCRYVEAGRFMTLFLAQVDMHARLLNWCSAGQGPVYIYHRNDQCFETLDCTGPPLGVLEGTEFESRFLMLRDGDILIVGTDGLWEARNSEGEMFSIERVRQLLATWHHKTAEEICEGILARVKSFSDRDELDDDTSLMIVKVPVCPRLTRTPL